MKKLLFYLLLITIGTNVHSQDYSISFAATGAATTVSNVYVQNLTKGTSLTILGSDILHLTNQTGINSINENNQSLMIYPNPMKEETEISFFSNENGNVQLSITDISGKKLIQIDNKLYSGKNKFKIKGLKKGIYFINIVGEKFQYGEKLISENVSVNEDVKITSIENEKMQINGNSLKSTNSVINMTYTDGDHLLFKGVSGTYNTTIEDVPTGNKTITFTFIASCNNFTVTHTAGNVAPVTKTITYETVATNLTGNTQCWIVQNLGATHKATAATDSTEASGGWYWQFNRKQGFKHDGTTRTPNTTWVYPVNEESDWLAANDPCSLLLGTGWRMPTDVEWTNADAANDWGNYNDSYASALKLHTGGYINYNDATLHGRYSYAHFWGSTQLASGSGLQLLITVDYSYTLGLNKGFGFSLRCLK